MRSIVLVFHRVSYSLVLHHVATEFIVSIAFEKGESRDCGCQTV